MEGEREQTRNQTEGSGQQPPLGKQDENQIAGQAGQQPQERQQGASGTQEPGLGNQTDQEFGSTGGQSAAA